MDFQLTEEQRALADTVGRFIERDYGFEARWSVLRSPEGWSRRHWQTLAELGLTALPVPESAGGLGGGGVETMLVMEAFGRGLVLEPWLGCVFLPARLLSALEPGPETQAWLEGIAAGERLLAVATTEPGQRYERAPVETRAVADGDGWRLTGRKVSVLGGDCADTLLVTARIEGQAGTSLFAVAAAAPGVTRYSYPLQDGTRGADLAFDHVSAERVGAPGAAGPALEWALDAGTAALCAEGVGVMDALVRRTVDYLKTRRQFGRPIGANQALQHRAVDMLIETEMARSMAIEAALAADDADPARRARAIAAAKFTVARACRFVGQQAVQLHGGIGVTHELDVSHYFKRATLIALTFGDADWQLARYGEALRAAA
jgi:alkylation response protein AidB-like acyl-CoA dehydrogenase